MNNDPGLDRNDPEALRARIADLEARLAEAGARERGSRDPELELHRAIYRAQVLERGLENTKQALHRARNRRIVRLTDAAFSVVRMPARSAARSLAGAEQAARRIARRLGLRRFIPRRGDAARAARAALAQRIISTLPPARPGSGRITVFIEAHDSADTLRGSLEALRETDWADLEVLVVGPTADRLLRFATGGADWSVEGRRWVRPVVGETPAQARREALAIATGDRIVLLHDDVRPIEPGWLSRLAAALDETGAGAVGACLLLPPGSVPATSPTPALTVAHLGIEFDPIDGFPEPAAIGLGSDPLDPGARGRTLRPAASEACLLVHRSTLEEIGLPPPTLEAVEPVELCLRIRASGRPIFVEGDAVLWHRGALRETSGKQGDADNLTGLVDRWGPRLFRSVLLDRLAGDGQWSSARLRVGITLTKDEEAAGFGDWYTAHELGDALTRIGWEVAYLERFEDRWYEDVGDRDVVVNLLVQFDLFRIPRHVISVAWIRNWTEEWTARPWFSNYDIALVSSERSKTVVEAQSAKVARVFPIATNPRRFYPRPRTPELRTDAVFTGSNWGAERGVAGGLAEIASRRTVGLHGRGWEDHPVLGAIAAGLAAYEDLPDIYASTDVAIDDAAVSTKPYGSVNSRVFDALATGTIVVTDNEMGAHELFDTEFPTWTDADDLVTAVNGLIDDPERRDRLVERYRRIVLDRHTYDHRAVQLRDILREWTLAPRMAVHIGPQTWEAGSTWGDVPYGRDVQRQLERRGISTALLVNAEGGTAAALCADVALHIFGVRAPRTTHGQVNLLWVISHPDRVTESLCAAYDVVFLASDLLRDQLAGRVRAPLVPLHQATEPARFFPDPTGPKHELLFIGNSRRVPRPIIEALRGTDYDLAVYGGDWTPELLDPKYLRGEWVRNEELRKYYSSADVVLNDHWGDMRELGIISNRVYDALACGAFVVSDRVPGIDEEFDGAVATYETREELYEVLGKALADPEGRAAAGARGRAAVLARHTFERRVDRILEELLPRLARQQPAVEKPSSSTTGEPADRAHEDAPAPGTDRSPSAAHVEG